MSTKRNYRLALPLAMLLSITSIADAQFSHTGDDEVPETFAKAIARIPAVMPAPARELLLQMLGPPYGRYGGGRSAGLDKLDDASRKAAVAYLIDELDVEPDALDHMNMMHVLPDAPVIRCQSAIHALGDKATQPLIDAMLKHEKVNVRANAAGMLGLGYRKPPEVIAALGKATNDKPQVVLRAIGSLAQRKGELPIEPLMKILNDPKPVNRAKAIALLERAADKNNGPVVEALIRCLDDPDEGVFRHAAYTLGEMGAGQAVPTLIERLKADSREKRQAVIFALGKLADQRATLPLIEFYPAIPRDEQWYILWSLGHIGDARAVPLLNSALTGKESGLREVAAGALGGIHDPAAVEKLIDALKTADDGLRRTVVRSLGNIGDAKAVDGVIPLLRSEDSWLAYSAATALGQMKDPRAIGPLVEALYRQGVGQYLPDAICKALLAIKDPAVVPALIRSLPDEFSHGRVMALQTLNQLTGEKFSDKDPATPARWRQWLINHPPATPGK